MSLALGRVRKFVGNDLAAIVFPIRSPEQMCFQQVTPGLRKTLESMWYFGDSQLSWKLLAVIVNLAESFWYGDSPGCLHHFKNNIVSQMFFSQWF